MIIYRCPRGHTRGDGDFPQGNPLRHGHDPRCLQCELNGWPTSFMEKMEVVPVQVKAEEFMERLRNADFVMPSPKSTQSN